MEHNDKVRTILYIDVEEFQATSRRPISSPDPLFQFVPSSPTMASTSGIGPLTSPEWVPRSRSPENWGPTSPGPVPSSPPYIPRSHKSAPGGTSPADYLYYPTSPGPVPPSPPYIPQSPEWAPGSVSPEGDYYPTSPGPGPPSPACVPRSPEWVSASPPPSTLGPTSPPPVRQSPAYTPNSPQSVSRGTSPTHYYPTSPGPVPPSPPYIPRSPVWAFGDTSPETHLYYPTSPGPGPQSPAYTPTSPQSGYRGTSPVTYYPTTPGPVPPPPPYVPRSPPWEFTFPSPVPLSPSSPAITDPFNELDGSWGRGRFVYNRARSIVAEKEEGQRQRGDRETSTEPFPELPDWEENENTERDTEDNEGLPDYQYYEQLDREEKGVAGSDAKEDARVQDTVSAVPDESSSPLSNYLYSGLTYGHPSTPFPWRRSSPILSTSSASPEEPEISESEDLSDNEYYEQLDQETAAETLIRMEREDSVVENPYTAIAALNCEPSRSDPYASYPPSEIDMHHEDAKEEHANWFSPCSSFSRSSAINNPACRVSQRLVGCVKVQKRIDRMMWNKVMQKKMVRMMEVCEKYAPADVLKELKR